LISKGSIDLVPVDLDQAQIARLAFSRFGKGRHPASLNFGDCFSYALATALGEPLLFKGGDFALTDVAAAIGG
jgi:ribonuclease VapC